MNERGIAMNERGITLQTTIVTAVLALAAAAAGIVIYNVISDESEDISENAAAADGVDRFWEVDDDGDNGDDGGQPPPPDDQPTAAEIGCTNDGGTWAGPTCTCPSSHTWNPTTDNCDKDPVYLSVGSLHNCIAFGTESETDGLLYDSSSPPEHLSNFYCWGDNSRKQLLQDSPAMSASPLEVSATSTDGNKLFGVKQLWAEADNTCYFPVIWLLNTTALLCGGKKGTNLLGEGRYDNTYYPRAVIGEDLDYKPIQNIKAFSFGLVNACAVADGETTSHEAITGGIFCWGQEAEDELYTFFGNDNYSVFLGVPFYMGSETVGARGVAVGDFYACFITSTGIVKCWGENDYSQLGRVGATVPDGIGDGPGRPSTVVGITDAVEIYAGSGHTCILTSTGTVKCWGRNNKGQLGDGTTTDSAIPVTLGSLTGVLAVDLSKENTCVVTSAGAVQCFGDLVDSNKVPSTLITDNDVGASFKSVGVGQNHICMVTSLNKIKCMGTNEKLQLGQPASPATTTQTLYEVDLSGL